jgi:hypothetical protein
MPDNAEPAQQTKTAHATASAPNQDPPLLAITGCLNRWTTSRRLPASFSDNCIPQHPPDQPKRYLVNQVPDVVSDHAACSIVAASPANVVRRTSRTSL